VVHVVSSWMLHRDEAEDGRVDATDCVRSFYLKITIFYILDHMDNVVFTLLLRSINRNLEGGVCL
jgi:hypothetical protein